MMLVGVYLLRNNKKQFFFSEREKERSKNIPLKNIEKCWKQIALK